MKSILLPVVILAISAAAGWMLGANVGLESSGSGQQKNLQVSKPTEVGPISSNPEPDRTTTPTPTNRIPISRLDGLQSLHGSPVLSAPFWMADDTAISDPGFPYLAKWLKLSEVQKTALAEILHHTAKERKLWEQEHLQVERLEIGNYRLVWSDPDSPSLPALQQTLADEFGDELAEQIFFRGSLRRFFEPLPGWNERGVAQIDLRIVKKINGGTAMQILNGGWKKTVPLDLDQPAVGILHRLSHLLDLNSDADLVLHSDPHRSYPAAHAVPGKSGYVISPYSKTQIDVRNIPPGTLVNDPTRPPGDKAYFRIPPMEPR